MEIKMVHTCFSKLTLTQQSQSLYLRKNLEDNTQDIASISAKAENVTRQQKQHSVFTMYCKRLMPCHPKDLKQVITKYMTQALFVQSNVGCGKQEVTMTHGEQNLEVEIM